MIGRKEAAMHIPHSASNRLGRLERLARALGLSDTAFCAKFGLSDRQWVLAKTGRPIGLAAASRIVDEAGVTLDWIYRGRVEGLPVIMARSLGEPEVSAARAILDGRQPETAEPLPY
jgi:hypothetical protein